MDNHETRDTVTQHDIALLRLAAQRIAGAGFATATDAVGWLTAVQAQDYPGAVISIALRTESKTRHATTSSGIWPQTGTLCYGPVQDGEQCIALVDEWVAHPKRPERDEALGEWALRYFQSHEPATIKDFAW